MEHRTETVTEGDDCFDCFDQTVEDYVFGAVKIMASGNRLAVALCIISPCLADPEGVHTTGALAAKKGKLTQRQAAAMSKRLRQMADDVEETYAYPWNEEGNKQS